MAKQGVTIQLVEFSDYTTPNAALNNGEVDLDAFQHYAYLNKEIKSYGYNITAIGDTFISAMDIYSNSLKDVSQVKAGDKVAVPNDATNEGRALKILEAAKLITLNPSAGDSPEVSDITSNPKNLQLVEVDAANVYALLPDVAIAVINCNYALDNGLNPGKDGIFQDNVSIYSGNNYVNLIAARTSDANNEIYKKIVAAYQTDAVKAVFADTFKGAYVAAWGK
jgi:D-methionine transport system substrate-binding protein